MKNSKKTFMLAIVLVLFVASLAAACAPAAPAAEEPAAEAPAAEEPAAEEPAEEEMAAEEPAEEEMAAEEPAEEEMAAEEPMEVMDFVSWFQFDQNNEDPASDERVGNVYLAETIPQFNADFEGQYNWINIPKAWDKIPAELVAAVFAGGDVPDLVQIGSSDLAGYYQNGALQDIRGWAEQQSWWGDLDPSAINACTGPDGGLYCMPFAFQPGLVYVWADHFPNGYPTTIDEFYVEAERLKSEGKYIMTFFGSTQYDGSGATRAVWTILSSFGGTYSDDEGNMLLNTPENIAAIEFLRDIVAKEYVPEIVFAGGFQEEEAFKDSSAASFPTGLFGYRYVNPLTAPDGTKYETGTADDMLNAIADGAVTLEPFPVPEGQMPGCSNAVAALAIPVGAVNPEGAQAYFNWIMTDADRNARYTLEPGAGFPALRTTLDHPDLQAPFYQHAGEAIAKSACSPYNGTLQNPAEARILIMNAVYKLIKEDPTADIATELQAAQDEYNANNN